MAKNNEECVFTVEYTHDLKFIREYFYNRKEDDRYEDEDDRYDEYLDDGTYVYWKGWNQIYQTERTVQVFKVYQDDKLIDDNALIRVGRSKNLNLNKGDKIVVKGMYVKMDKLGKRQKNQGLGSYNYKRVYLTPTYIYDEEDYWEYKDEDVKCIVTDIPKQNIKLTDFY